MLLFGGVMRLWNNLLMFLLFPLLCVALSVDPARAEVIDRVVANVNGEIILYSELQDQIKVVEKIRPDVTADASNRPQLERDVLTQLVRQKLTEQEVKRLKIVVTNAEVELQIARIMEQSKLTKPQLEYVLKQSGQTFEKYREGVKKDLERDRLLERTLKSKVVVTDAQVDAYLKSQGSGPVVSTETIRLGIILLPADERNIKFADAEKLGREILQKLKGGAEFRNMAIQYSKGPAAQDGGDIGYIAADELAPYISSAIKGLKRDEISGLVRGPNGYYILKVLDLGQQRKDKSDTTVREKARNDLYQKEVNRKFEEWVKNLEAKSFIQTSL